jgi:hypothetical protein
MLSSSTSSTFATSAAIQRRRMHEVDEKKCDELCCVVFEPKQGKGFFQQNLPSKDYKVTRSISLEQPFYSKYNRFFPCLGHFCCKACGNAL